MGMDKYTKVKKIGEGSFGKAYLVRSKEQPGKQFVIKEINMGKMGRKEREESRKEVAVLAQLQHPNVVAYRESFEELTNLYIVMDFCDGGDLYSKISAQRGILFPEEQIMDWFVQLCLSIKHIHDRKILHRDIKSQNIFLTRSGIVKLGDFGIAKVLNSTVELARTCIGTPYYLSPEICENRPYNNKSDIWSLGCVLYELATLKHAFEAGNMKNLVLKIIRGSYPPVAPKYSYELRMLVGQLFKRNPRDRPSISTVLKKPFIQRRIQKFLSETELQSEFSHTVMHGHKIHKQLPLGPAAGRQPFAKPAPVAAAKRPISAPSKKYNPASVYGKPAVGVRKSGDKENRSSADKKKPGGGGVPAVGGVAGALNYQRNDDVNKRRQELVEREKQRKADYARQHRDLIEKQRVARMNKAREEGWKNLVSSLNSNEDDDDKKPGPRQAPSRPAPAPKPAVVDSTAAIKQPQQANVFPKPAAANDRGDYDKYHAYLDKIQAEQEQRMKAAAAGAGDAPDPMDVDLPVARPMGGWPDKDAVKRELDRGDNDPTKFAEEARQKANAAAERAKQVEEFLNRKREAAYNRQRVKADVFGNVPPSYDGPTVQKQAKPSNIQGRNVEEQDYLARLRQIRLQNFQERRAMKARQGEGAAVSEALGDPKFDPDARRKKIEALRAQADARAKQLKEQLEKKREDVFAKQKEQWRKQQEKQAPSRAVGEQRAVGGAQRAAPQRAAPQRAAPQRAAPQRAVAAEPSPGLTNVMQAIGVTPPEKPIVNQGAVSPPPAMTNVFAAIGVDVSQKEEPKPESEASSPLQKQKKEILKKLNEKAPPARGKWGAPVQPAMEPAQESVAERPKWGGAPVNLGGMSLEETASNMEATNAADIVIKNPDERPLPVRKQWGGPAGTALNFLQGAKIIDSATMNIDGDKPSVSYLGFTYVVKPAATIVVTKPPSVAKGTIVISSQDKGEPDVDSIPEISAADDRPDSAQGLSPTKPTASPKSAWGEEKSLEKTGRKSPRPRTPKTPKSESPEIAGDKLAKSGRKSTSPRPRTPKTPKSDQRTEQDASAGRKSASPLEGEEPKAGSPQKLFERVQLDDDEDETKQEMTDLQVEEIENEDESEGETNPKLSSLHGGSAGVVIGVTTGHFDMADRSMLRTCSMPDLSKLFRTAADNLFFQEPVSVSVDVAYLDNECEDSGANEDTVAQVEEDKTGDESSDDVSDDDDDSGEADEEDMKSLRETMEKLLEANELNVPESEKPKSIKTVTSRNQKDELEGSGEVHGTIIPGKEEWESDDGEDTMFDESEEDTFCRLEESRLELEEQLGCDVFMKAYKTVQALQEDEDEAIEDGHKAVSTILGKPNEHLYQKILNLVLADGAYLEDND